MMIKIIILMIIMMNVAMITVMIKKRKRKIEGLKRADTIPKLDINYYSEWYGGGMCLRVTKSKC